jgi:FAD/FMN-containing dehydrogenase
LTISNIFHAGDGNMHPIILFDARKPGELARARAAGEEILTSTAWKPADRSRASTASVWKRTS